MSGALLFVAWLLFLASFIGVLHAVNTRHVVYRASALRASAVLWIVALLTYCIHWLAS